MYAQIVHAVFLLVVGNIIIIAFRLMARVYRSIVVGYSRGRRNT